MRDGIIMSAVEHNIRGIGETYIRNNGPSDIIFVSSPSSIMAVMIRFTGFGRVIVARDRP